MDIKRRMTISRMVSYIEVLCENNLKQKITRDDIKYLCSLNKENVSKIYDEVNAKNTKKSFLNSMYLVLKNSLNQITDEDAYYIYMSYVLPMGEMLDFANDSEKTYVDVNSLVSFVANKYNTDNDMVAIRLRDICEIKNYQNTKLK